MRYETLPKKKQKMIDQLLDQGWTFNSYPGHRQSICFEARCYIYCSKLKDMEMADVYRELYNSGVDTGFSQGRNTLAAQCRSLLEDPNKKVIEHKAEDFHLE